MKGEGKREMREGEGGWEGGRVRGKGGGEGREGREEREVMS